MRKDAAERRDALRRAAVAEFSERGLNVPLEVIADRAGVGRATLYRNFADRDELVLAAFEGLVEQLAAQFAQWEEADAFLAFVNALAELLLRHVALSAALRRAASREALLGLRKSIVEAGRAALVCSQAAGVVRADLDEGDIRIIASVLGAGLEMAEPSEREAISHRTRKLILNGLMPRP